MSHLTDILETFGIDKCMRRSSDNKMLWMVLARYEIDAHKPILELGELNVLVELLEVVEMSHDDIAGVVRHESYDDSIRDGAGKARAIFASDLKKRIEALRAK